MNQAASKLEFRIAIIIGIQLNYATQYAFLRHVLPPLLQLHSGFLPL